MLLLREAVVRTATLVAQWQAVGWAHGVLNTDNMSVLGMTLDYGPYGFMDTFEPDFVPNHSDHGGRYAFGQQPAIGLWNVTRLAEALLPLIAEDAAVAALAAYEPAFIDAYGARMRARLGLREAHDDDGALLEELFTVMAAARVDHTIFWRALTDFRADEEAGGERVAALFPDHSRWSAWSARYAARLCAEGSVAPERQRRMLAVNPLYVLRNYMAETAIRKAEDDEDYGEIERLRLLLRDPFTARAGMDEYAGPPPSWAHGIGVSCSS